MTVSRIRKKRNNQFTQISNNFLEDDRISFKSKGIFIYLWSKPDKWKIVIKDISNHGKENESAIRSAFHELREFGYMDWQAVQGGWDYFISDEAKISNIRVNTIKNNNTILPPFIDQDIWKEFLSMRKKLKAPNTETALNRILKKLEAFEKQKMGNGTLAIENSIENGWKGVFEPKQKNTTKTNSGDSFDRVLKEIQSEQLKLK